MRLIDADALMQTLGITDTDCGKCDLHGAMGCSKKGRFVDACVAIETAPTIEERKKGKWILKSTNGEEFYCCSECGRVTFDDPTNYCPNCGSYNGGGDE